MFGILFFLHFKVKDFFGKEYFMSILYNKANPNKLDVKKKFFEIHYQVQPEYDGFVFIYSKKRGNKLTQVRYCKTSELSKVIFKELTFGKSNYYITTNRFKDNNRNTSSLFGFSNIVVDLDVHLQVSERFHWAKEDFKLRESMIEKCAKVIQNELTLDGDIPCPNTIIYTGRGLQLWWALEPIHAKCKKMYQYVCEHILNRIEEIVKGTPSLECVRLDRPVTTRMAGVVRLPGSFNTATGRYGKIEILHDEQVSLPEFYQELWNKESACPVSNAFFCSHGKGDFVERARERFRMIIELIQYRQENGIQATEERRDLCLFVICNALLTAGFEKDDVMDQLLSVNQLFLNPMPEYQITSFMQTSMRKKGYFLKNETIINMLEISKTEQELFNFMPNKIRVATKEERKKKKEAKEERDSMIRKLCQEGFNKKQIAQQVGCSDATVRRVLKNSRMKTAQEKHLGKICRDIKKGLSVEEIVKKHGVSKTYVYNAAERMLKAEEKRNRQILEMRMLKAEQAEKQLEKAKTKKQWEKALAKVKKTNMQLEFAVARIMITGASYAPYSPPPDSINRQKCI